MDREQTLAMLEAKLADIRYEIAGLEVLQALKRLSTACDAAMKGGFDPSQPRIPAGNSGGGRWTSGGGGSSSTTGSSGDVRGTESFARGVEAAASSRSPRGSISLLDVAETLLSVAPQTSGAGRVVQALRAGVRLSGALRGLTFGGHKSAIRWANQMIKRGWNDLEEIIETINKGRKFPAPNKVNPGNMATRYENPRTGNYIVKDDQTGDILHLGDKSFRRPEIPHKKSFHGA